MIKPSFLKPGNTIGIVAPARKVSPDELIAGIKILEGWGFNVRLGNNLFNEENQFSGSDDERAADLQMMLDDPEVKAIISARGGYGTVRIIDQLDFTKFKQHPKWLIGYSDMTVLHNHLQTNFQTQSIHACMVFNMQPDKFDKDAVKSLGKALTGVPLQYKCSPANNQSLNRNGVAKGILADFSFNYTDDNRNALLKNYPDVKTFKKNFELTPEVMNKFFAYSDRKEVKKDEQQYLTSEKIIRTQIKALIARDLWNTNAYHYIINDIINTYTKAIECIQDNTFDKMKIAEGK